MARPNKPRRIGCQPNSLYFKPRGTPLRQLQEVVLERDELEALRLADMAGLAHEEVGQEMEVSRATAGRILARARAKVATALVLGHAIKIEDRIDDRSEIMPGKDQTGPQGQGPRTGRSQGRCGVSNSEEATNERPGRGLGRGAGRGSGQGTGKGRGRGRGKGRTGRQ